MAGKESKKSLLSTPGGGKVGRSYGSTKKLTLQERYFTHQVSPNDTLQGISLKYGVTMEQIRRANKLYTNDSLFLRKTLNIPVSEPQPTASTSLVNGLGQSDILPNHSAILGSPFEPTNQDRPTNDGTTNGSRDLETTNQTSNKDEPVANESKGASAASSGVTNKDEASSVTDFLKKLDLQISERKSAVQKLSENKSDYDLDGLAASADPWSASSYQRRRTNSTDEPSLYFKKSKGRRKGFLTSSHTSGMLDQLDKGNADDLFQL
ncbi:lysM and putative peptidoglycan-binding domain-containing protein 2-like [Branchiostoma floridae]|uniref:LysM and putative peptidoglycan-binding domain-containing protein 2-like n=1 Tax=Branchiostoma floridae TaxID=7739 RepID=A0A9J7KUT8_BRAFL|nr:lysM and putative peptidoglycan-binding domain-containing protein 2-like [Branchiostoma floridae]